MRYPVIVPKKTLPPRKVKQLNSSQSEEISVSVRKEVDEIDSTEILNKKSNEDLTFNSEKSLAETSGKLSGEKSEELRCHYCDKIQSSKSSLSYHIKTVHLLQNPFSNENSENTDKKKQIENKDEDNEVIRIDYEIDSFEKSNEVSILEGENYHCPHCEAVFLRKLSLNEHIKNFHRNISSESSYPNSPETESNILKDVNPTSKISDRRKPTLKLHKIKEIAFDSENFSYICQHLEILPVIFKCKNENCKAYKIMQTFDDIQIKRYFEEHDCHENTFVQVLGSNSPAPASNPNIVNVSCNNNEAIMDTSKFKSGGIGNCIQFGEEWINPNEFERRSGSRQGSL